MQMIVNPMLITYTTDGTRATTPHARILAGLIIVNATFALTVIFGWTLVGLLIEEPMAWATWHVVHRGNTFLELFYYPFSLLWLTPGICIMGAWLANKSKSYTLAYTFALFPLLFLALIFGWYHFTPESWR